MFLVVKINLTCFTNECKVNSTCIDINYSKFCKKLFIVSSIPNALTNADKCNYYKMLEYFKFNFS